MREDEKAPLPAASGSPLLLGLGLATAARCGPDLNSPDGVEAQTCVLTQGEETWARTYYRNATGAALDAVLSLMGPGARSVQMHCVVGADDEPDSCETPRQQTRGCRTTTRRSRSSRPGRTVDRCCCGPGATPGKSRAVDGRNR